MNAKNPYAGGPPPDLPPGNQGAAWNPNGTRMSGVLTEDLLRSFTDADQMAIARLAGTDLALHHRMNDSAADDAKVVVLLAKIVGRIETLVEAITDDGLVMTSLLGTSTIHPFVPELRQWVALWARHFEHAERITVATQQVDIEAARVELLERAMEAALTAAGVNGPDQFIRSRAAMRAAISASGGRLVPA